MNRKGIALVTVLIVLALLMAVVTTSMYLVVRSLKVQGTHFRYETGLNAAEGGVNIGINEAIVSFENVSLPSDKNANVGAYGVNVHTEFLGAYYRAGSSIEFASGYDGIAKAAATTGAELYYLIVSRASRQKERVGVEALYVHSTAHY